MKDYLSDYLAGIFSNVWGSPAELETEIGGFVHWYNSRRYHEAIGNVTLDDVYYRCRKKIQKKWTELKTKKNLAKKLYNSKISVKGAETFS